MSYRPHEKQSPIVTALGFNEKMDRKFDEESDKVQEKATVDQALRQNGHIQDYPAFNGAAGLRLRWKTLRSYALKLWPHAVIGESRVWHRSWIRFGPISGLFSLLLAAASMIVALGVLSGANGQDVGSWIAPPSTYLAVCTSVANLSVRYAAMQGVIIAWWRRASEGSTLKKLQSDWRSGTSIRGAITAGRAMGLLGLACVFSTVVEIGGPLLQRASTAHGVAAPTTAALDISMIPELPREWSGAWYTGAELGLPGTFSNPAFNATYPSPEGWVSNNIYCQQNRGVGSSPSYWWDSTPVKNVVRGCSGSCTARIKAPALFPVSCKTQNITSQLNTVYNVSVAYSISSAAPLTAAAYLVTTSLLIQEPRTSEAINLITGFVTLDSNCDGDFQYKTCAFESGIGEYEVSIQGDEIDMTSLATPSFVALANNTAINRSLANATDAIYGHSSTLGGVVFNMHLRWESTEAYYPISSSGKRIYNVVGLLQSQPEDVAEYDSPCPSYADPYDRIVNSMNKLMFYLGAQATATLNTSYLQETLDPGLSANTTVIGQTQETITVYRTEYWYFVGAAMAVLVSIALILPTYWGWWRLGRPVSLSPLETAKAFQSPMFAEFNSNSNGLDLAAAAGEMRVRYGAVDGARSRLAFADAPLVSQPVDGTRFDI